MLQSRFKSKLTKYLALSAFVTIVVMGYHIYLSSKRLTVLSKKDFRDDLNNQVLNLKNKYITLQQQFQQDVPQTYDVEKLQHHLQNLKESSAKVEEDMDILLHQIQQLPSIQDQQLKLQKITSAEEFARRRRRVRYGCSSDEVPGHVGNVLTHPSGVIYCIVPKAGCTFWKRIFTAATKKNNITIETISSISRESVHFDDGFGVPYNATTHTIKYPTRFIVTRDPYSRVFSSYLDKIYLPDFWLDVVLPMIKVRQAPLPRTNKDFLRHHFDKIASLFKGNSTKRETSTESEKECGKYVTFSEFIAEGIEIMEPHWMPIHQICNPCLFNVTHVSSMRTFTEDARVILAQMKQEAVLDNLDENAQVKEEINSVSSYNFNHFYKGKMSSFYNTCITPREIAYRLWHNFRWRGYIDPDIEYQIPEFKDKKLIESDFMKQVFLARQSGLLNPQKMAATKRKFKKNVFATISKPMFKKLNKMYALDFELFGNTDVRDELFSLYSS